MADLSDVEAKLAELVAAAIYPNGTSGASAIGAAARIYPGWPVAQYLDADLAKGFVNISVFPNRGTPPNAVQVNSEPIMLTPPVHGLTVTHNDRDVTVTGTPGYGEFVTILLKNRVYSRGGASAEEILAALRDDLTESYPGGATLSGSTLTVGQPDDIIVRVGARARMVETLRRIIQQFTVTIWAPSPELRHTVGALVNETLINAYRVPMADKSHLRCAYARTEEWDNRESAQLYRRDLVFNVDYAVTEIFEAVEVTSVTTSYQPVDSNGDPQGTPIVKVY